MGGNSAVNQISPLNSICWKVTLFVGRYTFHALEKAHCYKMPLENQQLLKFLLFMISLNFKRKSSQKKKMQQNEEKFKGLENFKKITDLELQKSEGLRPSFFFSFNFEVFEDFWSFEFSSFCGIFSFCVDYLSNFGEIMNSKNFKNCWFSRGIL